MKHAAGSQKSGFLGLPQLPSLSPEVRDETGGAPEVPEPLNKNVSGTGHHAAPADAVAKRKRHSRMKCPDSYLI